MAKTVLITGGSRGIGKGIVTYLAQRGYQIVLNYNRSEQKAKEIKQELTSKGYIVEIYQADVSKKEQVKELIQFTIEKFNTIDVLINNAGIDEFKLFTDITDEDWNKIIYTKLKTADYASQ